MSKTAITPTGNDIITVAPEEIRTPETIAAEINGTMTALRRFNLVILADVGEKLIEARNMLPHGTWGKWLTDNVHFSQKSAQRYIGIAENYARLSKSDIVTDLTVTDALKLIALPEAAQDEIIEDYDAGRVEAEDISEEISRMQERIKELEAENEQLGLDLGDKSVDADERLERVNALEKEKQRLERELTEKAAASENEIDKEVKKRLAEDDTAKKLKDVKAELKEAKDKARDAAARAEDAEAARRKALNEAALSGNEDMMPFKFVLADLQDKYNTAIKLSATVPGQPEGDSKKMRAGLKVLLEKMLMGVE
jgi:hypothetical protein